MPRRLQAPLAGGDGAGARGILRQHLADDEDLVAAPGDRLGHDPLGFAVAIHLGGVDQRHAEVEPELERGNLLVAKAAALAHAPSAVAEPRHSLAGGELEGWDLGRCHGWRECPSRDTPTHVGWLTPSSRGGGRFAQLRFALRMQLEGKHEQQHAEDERVGAKPPGQHHGADHRRDDQHDAEDDRGDAAKGEPPAAMVEIEAEGGAKHQARRR